MNFKMKCLIYILSLVLPTSILSQVSDKLKVQDTYSVEGIIRDAFNGDTLIGVTILLKDTHKGTISNSKGNFLLPNVSGDFILVFSYTGYETKEIPVSSSRNEFLTITLQQALTNIDEVKITSQRKFFGNMEYGRDIPTIGSKAIELQNVNNASDILHASVSGVWATKTSGSPGDHEKIRIRGQNSFFSSAEPLYVVDGVPVPIVNMSSLGIADLNIHDIENVTVLKDASSTALYGFQGGNGVVLIDTKKGGESEINFSTKYATQWFNNFYDQMNTSDYLASLQLAKNNIQSRIYLFNPKITDNPSNDNWQKEIFHTGSNKEYQLSASGTVNTIKYYLSGNYTDQQGILPNASYRRYTFSSRFSRIFLKKLAIDVGYRGSLQENKDNQDLYLGNPLLFAGITKSPSLRSTSDSLLYDKVFKFPNPRIYYTNYTQLNNPELPQSIIQSNNNSLRINSNVINGSARLQLTDHLSLNAMESLMLRYSNYYYNAGTIVQSNEDVFLYNHQYNISYFNTLGKHKVDLVAAYRFYEDNLWWKVDTMQGQLNSYSHLRNSMAAYGPNGSVLRSINSYVANASYNYNETYFASVVANVSNIKEGLYTNYYALFPSLALSWDIAHEGYFKQITWLSSFNLYTNWGKSGNFPLNGLANDLYQNMQYTQGTTTGSYPTVLQLANHNLKHECTDELDYGLKSSFFDKRITINATYYIKNINNLIIQRQIPYYYGGGMQYLNIGKIGVNGTEFSIEATPIKTSNFSWYAKLDFSTSRQIVKKVMDDKPMVFSNNGDVLMPEFIIKEGQSLGDIYGFKNLGKWTMADTYAHNKHYINSSGMKYLNADTTNSGLNANDMVVIGNSIPKYIWDFSNTFQYKSFSLNLLWYAVQGVRKYNATRAATILTGTNREVNNYLRDSLSALSDEHFYQSSVFIDDASFIRLKTITVNYEPSKEFFGHLRFRFALSFENIVTITKYKGYDPEATTFTDNNFSDNSIDRGSVPNPKTMYATISIKF
jgi:TonB-linked SusC/RagA family outer membrane protein